MDQAEIAGLGTALEFAVAAIGAGAPGGVVGRCLQRVVGTQLVDERPIPDLGDKSGGVAVLLGVDRVVRGGRRREVGRVGVAGQESVFVAVQHNRVGAVAKAATDVAGISQR